jgi:hypothetical protein
MLMQDLSLMRTLGVRYVETVAKLSILCVTTYQLVNNDSLLLGMVNATLGCYTRRFWDELDWLDFMAWICIRKKSVICLAGFIGESSLLSVSLDIPSCCRSC